jgi:hypothetical protein
MYLHQRWFVISVFLTLLIVPQTTQAKEDACSPSVVLASFEAAALSENVETWAQQYEDSECPPNVKRGAQQLAGSYATLHGDRISTYVGGRASLFPSPDNPLELNNALE